MNIYLLIIFAVYLAISANPGYAADEPEKNAVPVKAEKVQKEAPVSKPNDQKKEDVNSTKESEKKGEPKKETANNVKKQKTPQEKEQDLVKWINSTIDFGVNKDRSLAISYILDVRDAGLRKALEDTLVGVIRDETDSEVRIKAIVTAGELQLKAAVPEIQKLIDDSSDDVRISSVFAIKRIGDTSAKDVLIEKLKEQNLDKMTTLSEALIDTLSEFKVPDIKDFAIAAIKSDKTDRGLRQLFVLYLGKANIQESKDFLASLLKNNEEDIGIRSFAASSLAHIGNKESAKDIGAVLNEIELYPTKKKNKFQTLYLYCISSLVKLGDDKVLPSLLNSLRNNNTNVRLKAISLLKDLKDKRTIDILKYKMNYDPSAKVRDAARDALAAMGVDVPAKEAPKQPAKEETKKDQ